MKGWVIARNERFSSVSTEHKEFTASNSTGPKLFHAELIPSRLDFSINEYHKNVLVLWGGNCIAASLKLNLKNIYKSPFRNFTE